MAYGIGHRQYRTWHSTRCLWSVLDTAYGDTVEPKEVKNIAPRRSAKEQTTDSPELVPELRVEGGGAMRKAL
eukprot:3941906-Rhodomonas_salina.3